MARLGRDEPEISSQKWCCKIAGRDEYVKANLREEYADTQYNKICSSNYDFVTETFLASLFQTLRFNEHLH